MKLGITVVLVSFIFVLFNSNLFSQAQRRVLFEEATNASCGPCASGNPELKAFLDAHPDETTAIKYHTSFPGYDPMYFANPVQNDGRTQHYYSMNATPYCNADGVIDNIFPFNVAGFTSALNQRLAVPVPLSLSVTDIRITGDSVKSTINMEIFSNLPAGDYKLRVMAIEGWIIYSTPPGTNGEYIFEEVFRKAYPDVDGTPIQTSAGSYQFVFTYKRDTAWADTSIYTVAFVQNDSNKEVLNSAKGSYSPIGVKNSNSNTPKDYSLSQNYPNPFNPQTNIKFSLPKREYLTLKVYNMLGVEVKTLAVGVHNAGEYNLIFDGSNLSSGIYFYRLAAGEFTKTRKMMLVK